MAHNWFCTECGQLNLSTRRTCKMCSNEDQYRLPRNIWSCPKCTATNIVSSHRCMSCGALAEWYKVKHDIQDPVTRFSVALEKKKGWVQYPINLK